MASKDGTMCEVSPCASQELAPQTPHTAVHSSKRRATCHLLELPCELLEYIVTLDTCASDMCALAQTCTKLCQLQYTKVRAFPVSTAADQLAGGAHKVTPFRHPLARTSGSRANSHSQVPWIPPSQLQVEGRCLLTSGFSERRAPWPCDPALHNQGSPPNPSAGRRRTLAEAVLYTVRPGRGAAVHCRQAGGRVEAPIRCAPPSGERGGSLAEAEQL